MRSHVTERPRRVVMSARGKAGVVIRGAPGTFRHVNFVLRQWGTIEGVLELMQHELSSVFKNKSLKRDITPEPSPRNLYSCHLCSVGERTCRLEL